MQTHLAQAARAKPNARSISTKCFLPQAPTQFLSSAPSSQDVTSNVKLYLQSFKHNPVGQQQFLLLAGKAFLFWTTYRERIANSTELQQRQGNFQSYHWKSGRFIQAKSHCLIKVLSPSDNELAPAIPELYLSAGLWRPGGYLQCLRSAGLSKKPFLKKFNKRGFVT